VTRSKEEAPDSLRISKKQQTEPSPIRKSTTRGKESHDASFRATHARPMSNIDREGPLEACEAIPPLPCRPPSCSQNEPAFLFPFLFLPSRSDGGFVGLRHSSTRAGSSRKHNNKTKITRKWSRRKIHHEDSIYLRIEFPRMYSPLRFGMV
jgi:hypothetical protein